jgi:ribose 1,5-bisphosphokinase PhnN
MGFSERNYKNFISVITQPYGLILVCGPTGSGKTTTLHSALSLHQQDRDQDLDRRRSRGNHPAGTSPGAGEAQDRFRFCRGHAGSFCVPTRM